MRLVSPVPYLASLTNKVYKLLPLREDEEDGKSVFLASYADDLCMEMVGALRTYESLAQDGDYHAMVNTMQYMTTHDMTFDKWRSEVLKMLHIITLLKKENGGDRDGAES